MTPRDIGQLLDEVLAERTVGEPAKREPVVTPRGTEVVVVRPASRSQRSTGRARPAPMAKPVQQPAKRLGPSVVAEAQPAAAATQAASALPPASQAQRLGQGTELLRLIPLLRSPSDIRRAMILREVLGPPLSRRRR